jgi:hypothetical protein
VRRVHLAALLRQKLATAKLEIPWDEVVRDLSTARAVTANLAGEHYLMHAARRPCR